MSSELVPASDFQSIGLLANQYAARNVFSDYQERLAENTKRRQADDLALFCSYLLVVRLVISSTSLAETPSAWEHVTHGLVDGFVRWMLQSGYSVGSINVRLATIKAYYRLASRAGVIPSTEYALIKMVRGYRHKEGRNIDQNREKARISSKKADPVSISKEQAQWLKMQPDTAQGRRDALLMCLLLDHGLRCGEIASLVPGDMNLVEGTLKFYRAKVDKTQMHELTKDTHVAALRYFEVAKPIEKMLMGSRKGGKLRGNMLERPINDRVKVLGEAIGLVNLSPHDCRHYWATSAIKGGTDIKSLQDAGGWSSPAMPLRYAESSRVANQGVKLG